MVTNIGNTSALTVISDNQTPSSGEYAWYCVDVSGMGNEPRAPIASTDLAAETNIKEKVFDLGGVYKIVEEPITSAADFDNLRDALDYWDANNSLLYLSVKNSWGVNLATRSTLADAASAPITQNIYQGKLFNFRWRVKAEEVVVSIEFHYTTL
jgi:hypothetical protein